MRIISFDSILRIFSVVFCFIFVKMRTFFFNYDSLIRLDWWKRNNDSLNKEENQFTMYVLSHKIIIGIYVKKKKENVS